MKVRVDCIMDDKIIANIPAEVNLEDWREVVRICNMDINDINNLHPNE